MFQIPANWIAIGSVILTVAETALSKYDLIQHTAYSTSNINIAVIAICGLIGIHQLMSATKEALKKK